MLFDWQYWEVIEATLGRRLPQRNDNNIDNIMDATVGVCSSTNTDIPMKKQPPAPEPEPDLPQPEYEPKSILIDKLIKAYELKKEDVGKVVELYYDAQLLRIMHANKMRTEGPDDLTKWFFKWLNLGEKLMHGKLSQWVNGPDSGPETKWALEQYGIGSIIAAGLAAHIDVAKARNVSSLWRFAGLDPTADKKVRGEKLKYNARLKTLCHKMGESFVKVSGKEEAIYGHLYAQFKRAEVEKNDAGKNAEAAKRELSIKQFKKDNPTKRVLESGKLPDSQLHKRAARKAVKIFLQHYWVKAREAKGLPVNEPYAIAIMKHSGHIKAA